MCLPDTVGLPFALEAQLCFICSLITLCGPICGLHTLLSMEVLFLLDLQNFLSLQLATSLVLCMKGTKGGAEHPVCREGCHGIAKLLGVKAAGSTAKIALAIWESQKRLFYFDSHMELAPWPEFCYVSTCVLGHVRCAATGSINLALVN